MLTVINIYCRYKNIHTADIQHMQFDTCLPKSPHVQRKLIITISLTCRTTKPITLISDYRWLTAAKTLLSLLNLNFPHFLTPMQVVNVAENISNTTPPPQKTFRFKAIICPRENGVSLKCNATIRLRVRKILCTNVIIPKCVRPVWLLILCGTAATCRF
jgi:hypothetical protein